MKKLLIFSLMIVMVFMTACNASTEKEPKVILNGEVINGDETTDEAETTEGETSDEVDVNSLEYGFLMDANKKVINESEVGDRKIVNVYFDPSCPACVMAERDIALNVENILKEDAVLRYYPVAFLGESMDGEPFHSEKVAAYIQAIVKHDPALAPEYMSKTVNENFYTSAEGLSGDGVYKLMYEELGGENWEAIEADRDMYVELMRQKTDKFMNSPELDALSFTDDGVFVPFIHVEGDDSVIDIREQKTLEELIRERIDN